MHLTQGLRRSCERNPDRPALIASERVLDWRSFERRVARLAGVLRSWGLEPGDRVAMLSHNCAEYFEFCYGVLWAGGVIVPLNNKLAAADLGYILDHSGARALIADADFRGLIEDLAPGLGALERVLYFRPGDGDSEYEALLAAAVPLADQLRGYEDLAGIFYTSGTTGRPKGVMLSHRNLLWNAMSGIINYRLGEETVYLHATPLFHAAGGSRVFTMVTAGATNVILPRFDSGELLAAVARHRVTDMLLVPTMIGRLVREPGLTGHDLSSLRSIAYGASPMPQSVLAEALQRLPGVGFCQAYGMTELSPTATFLESRHHVLDGPDPGRLRSCGRAAWGAEVRIADEDGRALGVGEVGEILVRGPMVMQGYWRDPEATARAVRDGWMHTGDAGYRDADGFIYLVDRIKDIIITGGVNVASVAVEDCIHELAAVAECAVFGIPHPDWVEAVHAVVVPKAGADLTPEAVMAHCRQRLAGYQCPRSVEIRTQPLPLSGTGKIMKAALRRPYWDGYRG
ncbi:MAG: class I adenylate-forming enzyme family protein [Pseudomonadota bacterium]|jgi:long-chain acyl-CoA synthetase